MERKGPRRRRDGRRWKGLRKRILCGLRKTPRPKCMLPCLGSPLRHEEGAYRQPLGRERKSATVLCSQERAQTRPSRLLDRAVTGQHAAARQRTPRAPAPDAHRAPPRADHANSSLPPPDLSGLWRRRWPGPVQAARHSLAMRTRSPGPLSKHPYSLTLFCHCPNQ